LSRIWLRVDKLLLQQTIERLTAAGCDSPRREAELLWQHAISKEGLTRPADAARLALLGWGFSSEYLGRFEKLIQRRIRREPIAQILGRKAFWSLDFYVNQHTLTPRPDSETVVEAALSLVERKDSPIRLLDLGTGSGCLLLSLLHELPHATGLGVDASEEALAVAAQNAQHLQLAARATLIQGNWAQGINETFDMVISNPPYIPMRDLASLMPEVHDFEPHSALFAGADGLDDYRQILADMPRLLKAGGHAVLELGIGQAEAVRQMGESAGLRFMNTHKDLAQIDRAIVFTNH
jgi:release factor glutamine methyltransferase